jgi:hypothetical protein
MSDPYIQHRSSGSEPRCEFERTLEGEYCPQKGEVRLGGLTLLCNRHADLLRLEERTTYWRAMLAHLELWSGEARGRQREDLVGLLEIEWTRASAELGRASEELEKLEHGRHAEDSRAPSLWSSLFLLGSAVATRPP